MSIFVEFYIENDTSLNKVMAGLDSKISELFKNSRQVDVSDSRNGVKSVVYQINKPVMKSLDESETFFKNLKQLFELYQGYTPHFTQKW